MILEMRDLAQLICKLMFCIVWFSFIPRSLFDFNELNECLLFIYCVPFKRHIYHEVFYLIGEL